MTELWGAIVILLSVASGFVLWALWRPLPEIADSDNRQQAMIDLYRSKLAELEREKSSVVINRSDYDQRLAELQRTLLLETKGGAGDKLGAGAEPVRTTGGLLILFAAVAIPIASCLTYLELGAYNELEQRTSMLSTRAMVQQAPSVNALIVQLEQALEVQPNNPEGWYLLANSYMQTQNMASGIAAFEQALSRVQEGSQKHAALLGQYSQALFYRDGRFSEPVMMNISQTLAIDPSDVSALSLLGIQAFENGQYGAAVQYWQRAIPNAGNGQGRKSLQAGIASAQEMLHQGQSDANGIGAKLKIIVSLANGLILPNSTSAVLFVYGKKVGQAMPLFATKLDPKVIPINLELTNAMALQAGTRLEDLQSMDLAAHIALGGVPGKKPGDLVSQTVTLRMSDVIGDSEPIQLTIDQILK